VQTRCPLNSICIVNRADVDISGRVNVLDLIKIRNNLGLDGFENPIIAFDINGDGRINVLDLIKARNEIGH